MQAYVSREARCLQIGLCLHLQLSFMYASLRIRGGKMSTIWSLSSSTTILYVCKLTYPGRQEVYKLVFVFIYNYPLCMQADVSREARCLQIGLSPNLQLSFMYASLRIQGGKRSTIWSLYSSTTILYVCKLTYPGRQEVYNLVFVFIYNYPLCMQAYVSREARGLQIGLCLHLQLSFMYAS